MGSSRDWAAKGTALLGVKAVVAESFERIHRSNLVGMGVLPLQFKEGEGIRSLKLTGKEEFNITGLEKEISPHQEVTLEILREDGSSHKTTLLSRLDTSIDIEYYLHGGILPYVLRQVARKK
jgi:aconitate hydratase